MAEVAQQEVGGVPVSTNVKKMLSGLEEFNNEQALVVDAVKNSISSIKQFSSIKIDDKVKSGLKNLKTTKKLFKSYSYAVSEMAEGIGNLIPKNIGNNKEELEKSLSVLTGNAKVTETVFASDGRTKASEKIKDAQKGLLDILGDTINLFKTVGELQPIESRKLRKTMESYSSVLEIISSFLLNLVKEGDATEMKTRTESLNNLMTSMMNISTLFSTITEDIVPAIDTLLTVESDILRGFLILYNPAGAEKPTDPKTFSMVHAFAKISETGATINNKGIEKINDITEYFAQMSQMLLKGPAIVGVKFIKEKIRSGFELYSEIAVNLKNIGEASKQLREENYEKYTTSLASIVNISQGLSKIAILFELTARKLWLYKKFSSSLGTFKKVSKNGDKIEEVTNPDSVNAFELIGMQIELFFKSIKIPTPPAELETNAAKYEKALIAMGSSVDPLLKLSNGKIRKAERRAFRLIDAINDITTKIEKDFSDKGATTVSNRLAKMGLVFSIMSKSFASLSEALLNTPDPLTVAIAGWSIKKIGKIFGDKETSEELIAAFDTMDKIAEKQKTIEVFSETLKNTFKSLTVAGLLALPAMLGIFLIKKVIKRIPSLMRMLIIATNNIDKEALEDARDKFEALKDTVAYLGAVLGLCALIGVATLLLFPVIIAGFGVIALTVIAFSGVIWVIDELVGGKEYKSKVEAIKDLARLILLAGATIILSALIGLLVMKCINVILVGFGALMVVTLLLIGVLALIALVGKIPGMKTGMVSFVAMLISMFLAALLIVTISAVGQKISWLGIFSFVGALLLITGVYAGIGFLMSIGGIVFIALATVALILIGISMLIMAGTIAAINSVMSSTNPKKAQKNIEGMLECFKFTVDYLWNNFKIGEVANATGKIFMLASIGMNLMFLSRFIRKISQLTMTEFDDQGHPTGGKVKMKTQDFVDAAVNGVAIVQTIAALFKDGETSIKTSGGQFKVIGLTEDQLNNINNSTKRKMRQLMKITRSIGKMAKIVTQIASLHMETEWGSDGKPTKFQQMTTKDFVNSALNGVAITRIIAAILDENETKIDTSVGSVSVKGLPEATFEKISLSSKRKFEYLAGITRKIGKMAKIVTQIASLHMETEWGSDGKPTKFQQMKTQDFVNSAMNGIAIAKMIAAVLDDDTTQIETSVGSIQVKGIPEELYKKIDGKAKRKFNQLARITASIGKMAKIITDIASLNIPTKWNENGDPTEFRPVETKDFKNAALNGIGIAHSIIALLSDKPQTVAFSIGTAEIKGIPESLYKKVKNKAKRKFKNLSEITSSIGNMAQVMKDIASLNIPTKWNENGDPTEFRPITANDFKNAAMNGVAVARALVAMMNDETVDIQFSEGSVSITGMKMDFINKVKNKAKRKFKKLSEITSSIGDMADVIAKIATMQIPIAWDAEGNPTNYQQLKAEDYTNAVTNASSLSEAITQFVAEENASIPTSKGVLRFFGITYESIEDKYHNGIRKFHVLAEITSCIGRMANTIARVASLKIPIAWNNEGKPIDFQTMTSDDFRNAVTNAIGITKVIAAFVANKEEKIHTSIGDVNVVGISMEDIENADYWAASKFNCLSSITRSIGRMAFTIANVASLRIPIAWDSEGKATEYAKMESNDFINAAWNASAIAKMIVGLVANEPTTIKTSKATYKITGISYSDLRDADEWAVEKFKNLNSITRQIGYMARTIAMVASFRVPTEWNEKGDPINYARLTDEDLVKAAQNVGQIVTILVDAITNDTITKKLEVFENSNPNNVERAFAVISPINSMVNAVLTLAGGQISEFDEQGHPTGTTIRLMDILAKKKDITDGIINLYSIFTDAIDVISGNYEEKLKSDGIYSKYAESYSTYLKEMAIQLAEARKSSNIEAVVKEINIVVEPINALVDSVKSINENLNSLSFDRALTFNKFALSILGTVWDIGAYGLDKSFTSINTFTQTLPEITEVLVDTSKSINSIKVDEKMAKRISDTITTAITPMKNINPTELTTIKSKVTTFDEYGRALQALLDANGNGRIGTTVKQVTDSTSSFLGKLNSINDGKLEKVAEITGNLAQFSTSINGNFDNLAKTINENIIDALEKVQESMKELKEFLEELPNELSESLSKTQIKTDSNKPESPKPAPIVKDKHEEKTPDNKPKKEKNKQPASLQSLIDQLQACIQDGAIKVTR